MADTMVKRIFRLETFLKDDAAWRCGDEEPRITDVVVEMKAPLVDVLEKAAALTVPLELQSVLLDLSITARYALPLESLTLHTPMQAKAACEVWDGLLLFTDGSGKRHQLSEPTLLVRNNKVFFTSKVQVVSTGARAVYELYSHDTWCPA